MMSVSRAAHRVSFVLAFALVIALVTAACVSVQTSPTATSTSVTETPAGETQQGTPTAALPSSPTPTERPSTTTVAFVQPKSIADIVQEVRASVVHIQTEATQYNFFNQPVPVSGVGTGEILDTAGHIMTNNHVVEDARKLVVTLSDGTTMQAKLVGADPFTDLAVIKVDASGLKPIRIGKSSELRVGDSVIAMGHALDLPGGPTVTGGLVSAIDRSIDVSSTVTIQHLIQTDAAINPGNSGGPLLNLRGEMIGMNTAKIQVGEGIGFAIAIDTALPLVRELIEKGRIERGFLGISASNVTDALALSQNLPVKQGIIIAEVAPNSPAAQTGLKRGDIIVGLAGRNIASFADLESILFENRVGSAVKIEYYRGGQKQTRDITLGSRPAEG